jgi:hypothetical protein
MKAKRNYFRFGKIGFLCLAAILLLAGCADAVNVQECLSDKPYGFLSGLWHGFIAPVSFIASLFSDSIAMYAINNNGGWYDFGFVIGAGILFGGSGSAARR